MENKQKNQGMKLRQVDRFSPATLARQHQQRLLVSIAGALLGVHVLGCAACAPPLQTPAEDRSPPTWSRPEPEPVWAANWRQENRRSVGVNRNSLSGYGYRTLQNPFGCETIQASRTHTMVLFAGRSGRKQRHGVPTNWINLASIEMKHQRHWMARRADATFASTEEKSTYASTVSVHGTSDTGWQGEHMPQHGRRIRGRWDNAVQCMRLKILSQKYINDEFPG